MLTLSLPSVGTEAANDAVHHVLSKLFRGLRDWLRATHSSVFCLVARKKFIVELLMEQPDDPHAFLLASLKKLQPAEVDELNQSVSR
jgi:hypothetical protein